MDYHDTLKKKEQDKTMIIELRSAWKASSAICSPSPRSTSSSFIRSHRDKVRLKGIFDQIDY